MAHIACPEGEEHQLAKELQRRVLTGGRDGGFITFVDSRKGVETLAMATQQDVAELFDNSAVVPYRAGFTPEDRRRIEGQLQPGSLRGVVSTSALELGIDLPHLCVGFNVGVPPTRKAYRQRLGRVGRNGPGAFVVIGTPDAFRWYGTSFREYHDMSVEPSYLYLDNRFMQFAHGRCLADERETLAAPARRLPRVGWPSGFDDVYAAARPGGNRPLEFDAIAELGGDIPHLNYPLRNVGESNFRIKLFVDDPDGFGEVSQSQALRECYPGATYLHNARAYEVKAWNTSSFERPFIRVKSTSPYRSTRPRITTWINTGVTATELIEGHLLNGDNGFLAECQMLITERVSGYIDRRTGEFHSYRDLQQRNPNMKPRSRNFRTSGVVFCIEKDWFKQGGVKQLVSDRLREIFVHEYSVLPQDVGSVATNISVRDGEGKTWQGGCVAVFDQTYGSLRLTEKLYLEFSHILERLAVASAEPAQELDNFQSLVSRVREEFSGFSSSSPAIGISSDDPPSGYEQVFTGGSRVCFRDRGQIARDVEVIVPSIVDGRLMYQVKVESPSRHTPHAPLGSRIKVRSVW